MSQVNILFHFPIIHGTEWFDGFYLKKKNKKKPKFDLQPGVEFRQVAVVVPAGGHQVKVDLLCSAVVVTEEPQGVRGCVRIVPWRPADGQSFSQQQDGQQRQPG